MIVWASRGCWLLFCTNLGLLTFVRTNTDVFLLTIANVTLVSLGLAIDREIRDQRARAEAADWAQRRQYLLDDYERVISHLDRALEISRDVGAAQRAGQGADRRSRLAGP